MRALPFVIGTWLPYWFAGWGGIEFPVAATIIFGILVLTKTVKIL